MAIAPTNISQIAAEPTEPLYKISSFTKATVELNPKKNLIPSRIKLISRTESTAVKPLHANSENRLKPTGEKKYLVHFRGIELLDSSFNQRRAIATSRLDLKASDLNPPIAIDPVPDLAQSIQPISPPPTSDVEDLRQELLLPLPPVRQNPPLSAVSSPGSSALSPTAFGASFGQTFFGTAFQSRTRFTNSSDGSISAGFGLGNARKSVGLQINITVLNLFNNREGRDDSAFNRGGISFKLHKLLSNDFSVAFGIENALIWGFTDAGTSSYSVVSKIFKLKPNSAETFSRLTLSLGLGNGRFRSEDDFQNDADSINLFGSAGLRVAESVGAIADWNGQDLTLGASIVPFRNLPLVITPAFTDLTGSAGDGARFFLSIGYSYSFSF